MLAADGSGCHRWLVSLLQLGPLVMDRLRLVLVLQLFLGLGSVPLWPLVHLPPARLGLGSRYSLGSFLGQLALFTRLLWMGSFAASLSCRERFRTLVRWWCCERWLRFRPSLPSLHFR